MKALVIGASGYLGQSLTAALESLAFDVVACQHNTIISTPVSRQVRIVSIALADVDAMERLLDVERPDVVIHLASTLIPASGLDQYSLERARIIEPTITMLFRLAERAIPFVFVSSGGAIYGRTNESPVVEKTDRHPISFYGQAKLEIETSIQFVGRTAGLPYLIVRPSNPFGGSQSLAGRQGLVAAVFGCVRDNRPVQIWGDGWVVRDYIYVQDFSFALAHLIAQRSTGVVNIGSGIGKSSIEVVKAVESAVARPIRIEFAPPRRVDAPHIVLDVAHARSLGVSAPRPFAEGVREFAKELGMLNA